MSWKQRGHSGSQQDCRQSRHYPFVIVNALRKFESAGVIESRSSGMKGTYIKVLNDVVFDELKALKAQNNRPSSNV